MIRNSTETCNSVYLALHAGSRHGATSWLCICTVGRHTSCLMLSRLHAADLLHYQYALFGLDCLSQPSQSAEQLHQEVVSTTAF